MALSGYIYGTFSYYGSDKVRPYIYWTATQSIAGNYSDIYIELHFQKLNSIYWGFDLTGGSTGNININSDYSTSSITWDLRSPYTDVVVRTRTVRVNHNSDGTKTCFIGADGTTQDAYGTYNFSQTVTLDTIPREAYITNSSINFTIGDSIPITLNNAGNMYVKAQTYVNNVLIKTQNLGQVSSGTLTFSSGEIDSMYAQVPSDTSISTNTFVRITTYSDSGYSTQIGSNRDKTCTASVNQTTNKPTFSNYTLANVDKTIDVVDNYGNTVISSSTATLLGASTRMIKGYSKVRATITVANKMVALNSATPVKYRFTNSTQQAEESYSAVADVNLDLDNVTTNTFNVEAFDSRNLSTAISGSLSVMADYTGVNLFNIGVVRDNGVDALVTLSFEGLFWKKYFGSNHPSTVDGVLNTITAHYRFKNSTNSWTTQNGTFTVTIASPAVVTKNGHGLQTGDVVYLTTTGALPTGLSANTKYYVIYVDTNTFRLATSSANAEAGTAINTSGSQSGTHTINIGSPWVSITASSDGSGNISFSDYVDGDLGASGFDIDKSFTLQVRVYDKLSVQIIENTISVGTPLLHYTKSGIAVKSRYDTTEAGDLQVSGLDIASYIIPTGGIVMFGGKVLPSKFLLCDGAAVSRTTYSRLFDAIVPSLGTFTVTIASPAVVTLSNHNLVTGDAVYLTTTGALPTGLSANTIYYVIYVNSTTFRLATSRANAIAGTAINTSGSQSGTHTIRYCPWGLGNGSTTFNVPDLLGKVPVGVDNSQTEFKASGTSGGAKTHTLTIAELPTHQHGNVWNGSSYFSFGGGGGSNRRATSYSNDGDSNLLTVQNTGSGNSHNNLQPYQSINFIIRI